MADSEENYSRELGSERVNHVLNKPAQGNTIRPLHLPLQSGISSGKISFLACKLIVFFYLNFYPSPRQSVPLPSIKTLNLLEFTFDDELVSDQDTLLGTLAMVMDLKLHEHFNVEYQVKWCTALPFLFVFT